MLVFEYKVNFIWLSSNFTAANITRNEGHKRKYFGNYVTYILESS